MRKAAKIISIMSLFVFAVIRFCILNNQPYAESDELKRVYFISALAGIIFFFLFIVALILVRKKRVTDQRVSAAFAVSIVAVVVLSMWSLLSVCLPKEHRCPPNRPNSTNLNLLCELEDEDIQLYAISQASQPPGLVLFRQGEAFILNWKCEQYLAEYEMMLNKDFDGTGKKQKYLTNDELYVSIISEAEKDTLWIDLHVLHFTDTVLPKGEVVFKSSLAEYSLIGKECFEWMNKPISLKKPLQENENIVLFMDKEYPVSLSAINTSLGELKNIELGTWVDFDINQETKEVFACLNVYAEYEEACFPAIVVGHILANVHFNDGIFTLSDLEFVTVT